MLNALRRPPRLPPRCRQGGGTRPSSAMWRDALRARGGDAGRLPFCLRWSAENVARNLVPHGRRGRGRAGRARAVAAGTGVAAALRGPRDPSRLERPAGAARSRGAARRGRASAAAIPSRVRPQRAGRPRHRSFPAGRSRGIAAGHRAEPRARVRRNDERYRFVKWAQAAFGNVRVFPPGTGIIHQVNLEHLASVVTRTRRHDGPRARFPTS